MYLVKFRMMEKLFGDFDSIFELTKNLDMTHKIQSIYLMVYECLPHQQMPLFIVHVI